MRMLGATGVDYPVVNGKQLGVWAAEGASAATRDKPVSHGTTSCAQGLTLGLSVAPRDPRFSHVSLRCLLPPTLLEEALRWYGRCVRPLATCAPEEEVEEN